jgi:hypothetical protein
MFSEHDNFYLHKFLAFQWKRCYLSSYVTLEICCLALFCAIYIHALYLILAMHLLPKKLTYLFITESGTTWIW